MQIERTRGDTIPDVFTITNPKTRMAVNISGCSFKLTVSSVPDPVDATTQAYQIVGVITDAAKGVVEFAPSADQTNLIGYYYFDVEMTDSYGKILTLVKDTYMFNQDITK